MKKRLLPFALGAMLAATGYAGYALWPEPKVTIATYRFTWSEDVLHVHAIHCGLEDGVFSFQALDPPFGYVYVSLRNLVFGACLESEPSSVMRLD